MALVNFICEIQDIENDTFEAYKVKTGVCKKQDVPNVIDTVDIADIEDRFYNYHKTYTKTDWFYDFDSQHERVELLKRFKETAEMNLQDYYSNNSVKKREVKHEEKVTRHENNGGVGSIEYLKPRRGRPRKTFS